MFVSRCFWFLLVLSRCVWFLHVCKLVCLISTRFCGEHLFSSHISSESPWFLLMFLSSAPDFRVDLRISARFRGQRLISPHISDESAQFLHVSEESAWFYKFLGRLSNFYLLFWAEHLSSTEVSVLMRLIYAHVSDLTAWFQYFCEHVLLISTYVFEWLCLISTHVSEEHFWFLH